MADTNSVDQEFIEYLVKSLVDHPDEVRVDRVIDERGIKLVLHVNAADMGQVLGRQGGTITAIRSLLRIVGIKNNFPRLGLLVEEPEGSTRGRRPNDQDKIEGAINEN
jgi:predicted RNA-binding protein YlqC (UPF0109 family)